VENPDTLQPLRIDSKLLCQGSALSEQTDTRLSLRKKEGHHAMPYGVPTLFSLLPGHGHCGGRENGPRGKKILSA
jgi:hypothetical protein